MDSRLEDDRKQYCTMNPLTAKEKGRKAHHGLTGITQKLKISF
jgi:hypothetical protein